jgi:hypothetical protein
MKDKKNAGCWILDAGYWMLDADATEVFGEINVFRHFSWIIRISVKSLSLHIQHPATSI